MERFLLVAISNFLAEQTQKTDDMADFLKNNYSELSNKEAMKLYGKVKGRIELLRDLTKYIKRIAEQT